MWPSLLVTIPQDPASTQVSVVTRVMAKFVDLAMVMVFSAILPYPLGPLLGFAYSLAADGMDFGPFKGQSVGKKLFNLQVRNVLHRRPGNWRDSIYRNSPVGVATFFSLIPIVGWAVLVLVGVPLMGMEIYLMVSVSQGHRLGDVMADTEVVHYKEKETQS